MGTGASKMRPGGTAARYVAEEARNASTVELRNAFAVLSDSERERVMEALQTVNVSKASPPQAAVRHRGSFTTAGRPPRGGWRWCPASRSQAALGRMSRQCGV